MLPEPCSSPVAARYGASVRLRLGSDKRQSDALLRESEKKRHRTVRTPDPRASSK